MEAFGKSAGGGGRIAPDDIDRLLVFFKLAGLKGMLDSFKPDPEFAKLLFVGFKPRVFAGGRDGAGQGVKLRDKGLGFLFRQRKRAV